MTTENNLPAQEAAKIDEKPVEKQETPTQPAQPAGETVDEWDKDRAMNTIHNLREQEKQWKKDVRELERLKAEEQKRIEAQMSEQEKLQKQNAELAQKARELELSILRRDVIAETGLPAVLAERLKGDDKEAMLEDAKKLMESLPKPNRQVQNATNPGGSVINETDAQKRERLFGPQANIFDIDTVQKMGGGVISK